MYEVLVMSLHTFTLLMTILNALWTMRLLYSLKFFLNVLCYSNLYLSTKNSTTIIMQQLSFGNVLYPFVFIM